MRPQWLARHALERTHGRRRGRTTRLVLTLALTAGAAATVALASAGPAAAGVGNLTSPPMGWNDWNAFGCNVSAELIEKTADAMVANGMAKAGYKYVNIDDCWMDGNQYARGDALRATAGRVDGHLVPDPTNFPDGIKAVADYVHSKGLKLGIYESAGSTTCQGLAGSYGHESTDAMDFASWGVDYVKYDNCGTVAGTADNQAEYIARYKTMGDALKSASKATKHKIVYSVCEWGNYDPWSWAADQAEADLWRTTTDISDSWSSTVSLFKQNILLSKYSGPDAYNDPDMLEIGNGGQSDTEYRSQFSLWSMMSAPLIAGTPIAEAGGKSAATAATLAIYNNRDVIAVDQDKLARAATVFSHKGDLWTLVRPLSDGTEAVLLFNEGSTGTTQSVALNSVLKDGGKFSYTAKDLWSKKTTAVSNVLHANVDAHGVRMFKVTRNYKNSATTPNVTLSGAASSLYVQAGGTTTLTETLYNDGTKAVNGTSLTATAPKGWTIRPLTGLAYSVKAAGSAKGRYRVIVPKGTAAGNYSLTGKVRYYAATGGWKTVTTTTTVVVPPAPPTSTAYLSDLTATSTTGTITKDQQVIGGPNGSSTVSITLGGTVYEKGLGAGSGTSVTYYVGGHCSALAVVAGVDDAARAGSTASVEIDADGTTVYSGTLTQGTPVPLTEDVAGSTTITLTVAPSTGFGTTPVDWAGAQLTCS